MRIGQNMMKLLEQFLTSVITSIHDACMYTLTCTGLVVWLGSGIVLLLLELSNPGLFLFLSFCLGAVAAAGATLFGCSFITQMALFLAIFK